MIPVLRQIGAVVRINLLSIPQRLWTSLSAVIAIGFVVFVLLGALALNNGFEKTLNGTGSDSVILVLRDGSVGEVNSILSREQQQLIASAPGLVLNDGKPLVSNEVVVIVDGTKKSTATKANLPLRGISQNGLTVRKSVKLVAGRMFRPGTNEIIIGQSILNNFDGFKLNQEKRLGANMWKVVGVFDAGGSVFESELWADVATVQTLFKRGDTVQSIRAQIADKSALKKIQIYNASDPRLKTDIRTEKDFYSAQSKGTTDLVTLIGRPLAILMAIGALAGAVNAMYASVASRAREIATLRTIGFGGIPTFIGTVVEAVVLALVGALLGVIAALVFFDGLSASTLGNNFTQIVFKLELSTPQIVEGTIWASILGLLGGVFPAWRAARQPITSIGE